MNEPTPFGIFLRTLRMKQGKTLRQLAKDSELTFGYIAQIERGYAPSPSIYSIARLAEALGIPQSELLAAADRKKAPNAACVAEIYEHFKLNNALTDNQFVEIAEKHNLLANDLTLLP